MIKKWCSLSLLLISTVAVADFCPCPSNFNLIQIGNSLDQILKTCCKPSTPPKTYQKPIPVPQKWTYNIAAPPNPGNAVQGSVELTVTFDRTEKVTNITVNAQSLTTTNCGTTSTVSFTASSPNSIKIGDTMKAVEQACGKDKFVLRGEPQTDQTAPIITELQYAGPPPITLRFINGSLTEIIKGIVDNSSAPDYTGLAQ